MCIFLVHVSQLRGARIRQDFQKAEAYQGCLATELQQHVIPLIQQELDADVLCDRLKLEACMIYLQICICNASVYIYTTYAPADTYLQPKIHCRKLVNGMACIHTNISQG